MKTINQRVPHLLMFQGSAPNPPPTQWPPLHVHPRLTGPYVFTQPTIRSRGRGWKCANYACSNFISPPVCWWRALSSCSPPPRQDNPSQGSGPVLVRCACCASCTGIIQRCQHADICMFGYCECKKKTAPVPGCWKQLPLHYLPWILTLQSWMGLWELNVDSS